MKAKHLNTLIKEFCEENSYSEDVNDLLDFYWAYLRKVLVSKKDHNIHITGLGQFVVNRKKLQKTITRTQGYLNSLNNKSYKGFTRYKDVQDRLENLISLQNSIHKEVQKRTQFRKTQNDKKAKSNLGE